MISDAVDFDGRTEFARHAVLDPGRLDDLDALADDRPRRGLVRREEANRPQARVPCLQPSYHRVPLPNLGERPAIHVEREYALHLPLDHPSTSASPETSPRIT